MLTLFGPQSCAVHDVNVDGAMTMSMTKFAPGRWTSIESCSDPRTRPGLQSYRSRMDATQRHPHFTAEGAAARLRSCIPGVVVEVGVDESNILVSAVLPPRATRRPSRQSARCSSTTSTLIPGRMSISAGRLISVPGHWR